MLPHGIYCTLIFVLLFFMLGILARLAETDKSDMQKQGYEYIRFVNVCCIFIYFPVIKMHSIEKPFL